MGPFFFFLFQQVNRRGPAGQKTESAGFADVAHKLYNVFADHDGMMLEINPLVVTGEGDIAGALGRTTGLAVVGNGNVFVRGLGDRYSLALLNGLPLPSPQPLSRVVPLDIFPTNIVASSLVQKSYSANFPGEFGGGVINLTTRAVPDESFVKISAAGMRESHVHDVIITKEAPNYRLD